MTSQAQTPADQSPSGQNRHPSAQLPRRLLIAYSVVIALLVGSFISAVLGIVWPLLFNSVPAALAFFASLPLWLQILICVALLAALVLFAWLWRGYLHVQQADKQQKEKEQLTQQRGVVKGVVDEPLQQIDEWAAAYPRLQAWVRRPRLSCLTGCPLPDILLLEQKF